MEKVKYPLFQVWIHSFKIEGYISSILVLSVPSELCFYEESTVTFQINAFPCLARKIMKVRRVKLLIGNKSILL